MGRRSREKPSTQPSSADPSRGDVSALTNARVVALSRVELDAARPMAALERAAGLTSNQAASARGVDRSTQSYAARGGDPEIRTLREAARDFGGRIYLVFERGHRAPVDLRVARPMLTLREAAGLESVSEAARRRGRALSTQSGQEWKGDAIRLSTLLDAAASFGGVLRLYWRPRRSKAPRHGAVHSG